MALCGSLFISYQLGAELLNFGALLAFMGVNSATIMHHLAKGRNHRWSSLALPTAGFLVCLYIWLNLRTTARMTGLVWLGFGILFALFRRVAAAKVPSATPAE